MRFGGISVPLLVLLFATGCKPHKPELKTYRIGEQGLAEMEAANTDKLEALEVAQIGDTPITAHETDQALQMLPPHQRYYYSSPERVSVFLVNYAMMLLLAAQGEKEGLDADPYVRFIFEQNLVERYRQDWLSQRIKPADIPDDEVARYLTKHREELLRQLVRPDEVGVDEIDKYLEAHREEVASSLTPDDPKVTVGEEELRKKARSNIVEERKRSVGKEQLLTAARTSVLAEKRDALWKKHLESFSEELGVALPDVPVGFDSNSF